MRNFKAKLIARSLFVLVALVFLSANMAPDSHLGHSTLAKLITLNRQVRRNLSHAVRENLRTSVLSSREEIGLTPLQEIGVIPRPPKFVLTSYATPRPPVQFERQTLVLDLSPVLNL